MKTKIVLFFIFILSIKKSTAQVVINEYCASNINVITDYAGNNSDYIELYNLGAAAVNLGGYFLSDQASNNTRWTFPATVNIPANGRLMIFCSGDDTITPTGQVHSNFHLTQCKGNQVVFSAPSTVILDSQTMVRTLKNNSVGRMTDGAAGWGIFATPTPNAANNTVFTAYAERPVMSLAPGFYTGTQNVILTTSQATSTIRYTLDGTVPIATSPIYSSPIVVATTTVIRSKCFSSLVNILPSFTETNTYFINVTHSSPFNVISICGAHTTIGSVPGLFNTGQTVDNSVEFFDTLKNFKWDFEGISKRHGHDSWAYPQKGFRIYAKDQYGYLAEMPEKFFKNTNRNAFKEVILKAAASDNFAGNNGNNTAHMRDAYCHTFSIKYNWEFDERSYAPTIVYINGKYWGVYEIREKVDLDYVDYYYGQSKNKVDMVRHWGGATNIIDAGSDTGWTNLRNFCVNNNMANPANYAYVESVLNINSLIDFFVLNNYFANSDHMNWNTMWWRGRKGAGIKWKYALWDNDNIFDLGENFSGLPTTGPELNPCAPFALFNNSNIIFHTQIINALLNNPTFKQAYTNRYSNWLSTSLTCDTLLAHLNYFENLLAPEMPAQIARWPGGGATLTKWHAHVDSIRDFILKRCTLIGSNNDSSCIPVKKVVFNVDAIGMGKIKLNTTILNTYPTRFVTGGDSLYNIEAIANPGFRFKTWRLFNTKNTITPTMTSPIAFLDFREQDSIVAVFEVKPPDTFNVTITAAPVWAGTVLLDGATLLSAVDFPYTFKAVDSTTHTLVAANDQDHIWKNWTQVNGVFNTGVVDYTAKSISFKIDTSDVFTANFDTLIKVNKTVYIPNAFTPNGDLMNDYFGIDAAKNIFIADATVKVFDRYGTILYDGNAKNTGWDGKNKGEYVDAGVYMYALTVKYIDGKSKTFKGDVTMMR
jgi:gliding motility-associated-like protein